MSTPIVPQRPERSQVPDITTSLTAEAPTIPPRPARHYDRSQSRERDHFARSPLNDSLFAGNTPYNRKSYQESNSSGHLGERKPSVATLPLIGQEGTEYASLDETAHSSLNSTDPSGPPNQTRNVAGDLPLHAPKATVPVGSGIAKNKITPLTRTDSEKAAGMDIGKPVTEYEEPDHVGGPASARLGSVRPPSTVSTEPPTSNSRAESIHDGEYEHGIPMIGIQVPMYPDAGDVQAPSPAPYSVHSPGMGFFNDGSRPATQQGRRRSALGFNGPPGSYGLHGHGVGPQDTFEKDWYHKHPDEAAKVEYGAYGPHLTDRGQWAMSSDDLNKLVRGSREPGFGTNPGMIGVPTEAIGYMATEEYASRRGSPLTKVKSRAEPATHAESPLRKSSFAAEEPSEPAMNSESEDDRIHVDPPIRRRDKFGGGGYDPPTEDLGPHGGNTTEEGGWITERGHGMPILASDEVAKDPGAEWLQPAVSPEQEKRGDTYFSFTDSETPPLSQSGAHRSRSRGRPTSRPPSLHGSSSLSRLVSQEMHEGRGTPLEEIEEYEPLFKDDEKEEPNKYLTAADRLKRPDGMHRFPSQDIWEDTPTSLQLQTTVGSAQDPEERAPSATTSSAAVFESPDKELARQGEITEGERADFLNDPSKGFAKPKFKVGVREEMMGRPGLRHRFPSSDIWEDTPDSLRLETTVGDSGNDSIVSPQAAAKSPVNTAGTAQGMDEGARSLHSPVEKPAIPARPDRAKGAESQGQPTIPARPPQRQNEVVQVEIPSVPMKAMDSSPTERKPPSIPDRPKPQVPPRPGKGSQDDYTGTTPLTKTISAGSVSSQTSEKSVTSPPITKSKPVLPLRPQPGISKIATLKGGFMNDLNARLQLGPQAPPKVQPQEEDQDQEKAPLPDARKGRAKGPVRRKPAASPDAREAVSYISASTGTLGIAKPWTVWSIAESGEKDIIVASSSLSSHIPATGLPVKEEKPTVSPLARNTAGETLQPHSTSTTSGALPHPTSPAMETRAREEESGENEKLKPYIEDRIEHSGDVREPAANQQSSISTFSVSAPVRSTPHTMSANESTAGSNASASPVATEHTARMEAPLSMPTAERELDDTEVLTGKKSISSRILGEVEKKHEEGAAAYLRGDEQEEGGVSIHEGAGEAR